MLPPPPSGSLRPPWRSHECLVRPTHCVVRPTCCKVHFILSKFWKKVFSIFLGAKIQFFQKVLKKWSSFRKNYFITLYFSTSRGEGVQTQSRNSTFLFLLTLFYSNSIPENSSLALIDHAGFVTDKLISLSKPGRVEFYC